MTDLVMSVVFIVIALCVVVRTVFYAIDVIVKTKSTRKSMKVVNKLVKAYEPMLDWLNKYMDKMIDDM